MKKIILLSILIILGFLEVRAQTSKATVKSWFETGDVPTQTQFWTFIDNSYNDVSDDILDGQGYPTIKYAPYTSKIAGKFYVATANPTNNNSLKYDGYFYATKIYNGAGIEITGETKINIGYGLLKGVGDTIYVDTTKLLTVYTFNNKIAKVGYGLYRSNDTTKIDTTKIATVNSVNKKEPTITKSNGFLTSNGTTWIFKNLDTLKYLDATDTLSSVYKVASKSWVKALIDYSLTGSLQDMGYWDASSNTLPTVGSGSGGSVAIGDKWTISVKGKVTDSLYVGDIIIALYDYPEQDITKFNHIYLSQPKSINLVLAGSSKIGALKYNGRVAKIGAINGGTNYISCDSNLVYSGNFYANGLNLSGLIGRSVYQYGVYGYSVTNSGVYGVGAGYGMQGYSQDGYGIYASSWTGYGALFGSAQNIALICNNNNGNASNIASFRVNNIVKLNIDKDGYLFNSKPTFSSVFFDSTRVIELDVNTPKIISNTWGNLWPNTVLVGFTENKDTAIVGYTGNYDLKFNFNCGVATGTNIKYSVKLRHANSVTVTTLHCVKISNIDTNVNHSIDLNWNYIAGDRLWIEIENTSSGTDITAFAGSYSIVANYITP